MAGEAFLNTTVKYNFLNGIGVNGTDAPAQSAAPTAAHATVSQAGTDSGDVAIQAATNSSPFGYVLAAEFEAHLAVSLNNAARIAEIIACLQAHGFMATA